ncbi:hypothetical protein [Apibacter sp. HY039]|uniref:hypothetical protein n=1 Tax=Apibacter sp. HY039 TaxID=2501476 RepID=UPI000FEBEA62|nr:hypothetical protein [Apibacter sp. HY039]
MSKQTKENIFNIIKEGFEGDYIERNFHVDKQNFSFIGKPIIDSKNKIIEFSMKSDEIYGFSILFFTDNHFVQFSYTDNNKDFCIECYLAFKLMLFNSFKFK